MTGLPHDPLWPRAGDWPAWAPGERADAVIVGVPTSRTSLSPTQAHLTPAAVREALRRYSGEWGGLVVRDAGDVADPDAAEDAARAHIADMAATARLVIGIGGDNAATVPMALGVWGTDLTGAALVTVDAHHDLRDGISNGSPVRRLLAAGLQGARTVQLGIEPLANSAAYRARADAAGIRVVTRDALAVGPLHEHLREALDALAATGVRIHVDLDVDVCDRSVAPGCPASVPGGISAYELRQAARVAGAHPAVVGIDLTEVDAAADTPDGRTVRLVALCVLEALRGLAERSTR